MTVYDEERGKIAEAPGAKPPDEAGRATPEAANQEETALKDGGFYKSDAGGSKGVRGLISGGLRGRTFSAKKGVLVAALGGTGAIIIVLVLIVLFLLSSLKIKHLVENVTLWNMARTTQAYRQSMEQTTADSINVSTMDDASIQTIAEKGGFSIDSVKSVLDGFDKYRPGKLNQTFQSDLQPQFSEGAPRKLLPGNKQVFEGWTDSEGNFLAKSGDTNLISLRPVQNYYNKLEFAGEVKALIDERFPDSPSLVRGSVLKNYLNDQGIKLRWWEKYADKFKNANEAKAEELSAQQLHETVNNTNTSDCLVAEICNATNDANSQIESDLKTAASDTSENAIGAAAQENKIAQNAASKISSSLEQSGVTKVIGAVSIINSVVVPLCLIYDGSIEHSGKTIDATQQAATKTYASFATAAAQQQTGDPSVSGKGVGAMNDLLGDVSTSVPSERAAGNTANLTATINPLALPQAGGAGQYTILTTFLDSIGLPHSLVSSADGFISNVCPKLTDVRTQAGEVALQIALTALSFGSDEAAIEGTDQAVKPFFQALIDNIGTETKVGLAFTENGGGIAGSKAAAQYSARVGSKFAVKTGIFAAAIWGATEYAKAQVLRHMNANINGLATDETLANQVDMGGNFTGNETCRRVMYCAPLTQQQEAESNLNNIAFLQQENNRKSFTDRYLSVNNSASLVSLMGDSMLGYLSNKNGTILNRVLASGSSLFSGGLVSTFGSLLTNHNKAMAADLNSNSDYNIVQWGYTQEETNLINNDPTYDPIINALTLQRSGKADEINSKYGSCFNETMGTMLSQEHIVRNKDSSVIADQGNCSPDNLGVHNPTYGDLVFRWRLAQRNTNMLQHLTDLQSPAGGA